MENMNQLMQGIEQDPNGVDKLKSQLHFLEAEVDELKATDPQNPELQWKTEKIDELNQMISNLENKGDIHQDRKTA